MALECFPRLLDNDFSYYGMIRVPPRRTGRIDQVVGDTYGAPMMYKPIAAYSGVVNPTAARPGIRIDEEALRNELVLRGVSESSIDQRVSEINETREVGEYDWQAYEDNSTGVITSVEANSVLLVPDMESMFTWANRYANLKEEE